MIKKFVGSIRGTLTPNPVEPKVPSGQKKSSHWSTAPQPILQATAMACDTRYQSKDIYLKDLSQLLKIDNVADFGCGTAGWLSAAKRLGIDDVCGIDLAEIDISQREIEPDQFIEADLSLPINTGRKFDLVISTEVAEHIPEESADIFIGNLCQAGEFILFSAAIPHQGGMHHVNERWVEYWHEKFVANNYVCFDYLRPKYWNDPRIAWFYRQNCLLYVAETQRNIFEQQGLTTCSPLSMIHPDMYLKSVHRKGVVSDVPLMEDVKDYYEKAYTPHIPADTKLRH